jgi:RNA polymerase sigma-70 factor (ECF subfamily)
MERAHDDAALAAAAARGDADAFCALIRGHHRGLHLLALRYCGNHHDAEDLVQEVFLKAYRGIGGFRGASSFQTWLRRIMVNTFLNFQRANRSGAAESRADAAAPAAEPVAAPTAFQGVLVRQIVDRLGAIPPRQRLMFLMRHQEGLTTDEIARHFGTTQGTVKKTIFRVVERLRTEFASGGGTPDSTVDGEDGEGEEGRHARLPEIP